MHTDSGQNLWECGMLKGDFRKASRVSGESSISDLNGINTENIIHLNRFIFLVDGSKLEATNGALLARWLAVLCCGERLLACILIFDCCILIDQRQIGRLFTEI